MTKTNCTAHKHKLDLPFSNTKKSFFGNIIYFET